MEANKQIGDLIYPELSYKLMGVLFKVHGKLGNSYQEKYYQRAIEVELTEGKISFERDMGFQLLYRGNSIGKHYLDFVIERKIALEIKAVPFITNDHLKQLLSYLESTSLKLGVIANFRSQSLTYRRLVNPHVKILSN